MSDELLDEVEALNSIYGDNTLIPADDNNPSTTSSSNDNTSTYILHLPSSSSLRILFPETYPSVPPEILSVHHASDSKKGAGARDLRLVRESVGRVWVPGGVCMFDAVEEFGRLVEEEGEIEALRESERQDVEGEEGRKEDKGGKEEEEDDLEEVLAKMEAPEWTVSEVTVDMKSTFIAHVARITSPEEANLFIAHLLTNKRLASATHNITAYRVRGSSNPSSSTNNTSSSSNPSASASTSTAIYQDCDDDGETAAGSRLLHLMQLMDIWDAVVCVTRWYGGVKLGPRRFAVINQVAREGFVKAGMVVEKKEKGGKKGK